MRLKVLPEALEQLKEAGLDDRLEEVLEKAAIVSHTKGNRRYHNWIFDIQHGTLVSIFDMRNPDPSKTFIVYELCPFCEMRPAPDPKCGACHGAGEVKVVRPLK